METCSYKNMCNNVYSSSITIAKKWKQAKCSSTGEWINKTWTFHIMVIKRDKLDTHNNLNEPESHRASKSSLRRLGTV